MAGVTYSSCASWIPDVPYRDAHRKTHLRSYSGRCLSTVAVSRLTPGMQMTPVHHVDSTHPQTKDRGTYPSAKQTSGAAMRRQRHEPPSSLSLLMLLLTRRAPIARNFSAIRERETDNWDERWNWNTFDITGQWRIPVAVRYVRQNIAVIFPCWNRDIHGI